ncbi:hypothetical protein [Deinococcus radiotolerans]|uniref:Uncharacterized protein n=1 Tax=Deinococcus radiotolerans TaxID=1309407 RepID=A0ABQ2FGA2_9DEIO|nr:hypothetical protein [Deinococcus radiotolerans]GGK94767.1 hypothetical protein GCM10010844_11610 [Deinococcus radiotolerans]
MTTQTRAARLGQILLLGLGAGLGSSLLCLLIGAVLAGGVTRAGAATALGWGGLLLTFLAGAIIYSQNGQSQIESGMRARLGEGYRAPGLPWAQILTALIGAGVLFLGQFVLNT